MSTSPLNTVTVDSPPSPTSTLPIGAADADGGGRDIHPEGTLGGDGTGHRVQRPLDLGPDPAPEKVQRGFLSGFVDGLEAERALLVDPDLGLVLEEQRHLAGIAGAYRRTGRQLLLQARRLPFAGCRVADLRLADQKNDLGIIGRGACRSRKCKQNGRKQRECRPGQ
jgi:hypothetical protein